MTLTAAAATALGTLTVSCNAAGQLTQLRFSDAPAPAVPEHPAPVLLEAIAQVQEYLDGVRFAFSLPLAPAKTAFQQRCRDAVLRIPYGETRSYGRIAAAIGAPQSARAVGAAMRQNPFWLVVPCHRVVGKNGSLTGYAGGTERKALLLRLEGVL
ncbi:MAG: methylated-DNA--[protein]-cysteine S-methyltransferase [Oscillospiraceae bacterium]|nr:methylated-DNA--[protein]-cysteine S-methyltransferase [Oscillospiraceae bacterium]